MQVSGGHAVFQLCGWLVFFLRLLRLIRLFLFALPVLLCVKNTAFAVDLDEIVVSEKAGVYYIKISGNIAAKEEYVRQVLTDYIHVYRLSDSIIESKVLESSSDEKVRIQSLVLCCTTVFCREVMRVDEISVLKSGDLQAVIMPEQSDFRSGTATWKTVPMGHGMRLTYSANIEPDFFIPPVLGTQMVINDMRNEFKTMFCRIELIASINEARERGKDVAFVNIDREQCRKS